MRNVFLVGLWLLLGAGALSAQKGADLVKVEVLRKDISGTSNPNLQLVHFEVKLTNLTGKPLQFTNNHFALREASGRVHLVSRPWHPEGVFLEPGKATTLDRIYFELPGGAKPQLLVLFRGRFVLGKAQL